MQWPCQVAGRQGRAVAVQLATWRAPRSPLASRPRTLPQPLDAAVLPATSQPSNGDDTPGAFPDVRGFSAASGPVESSDGPQQQAGLRKHRHSRDRQRRRRLRRYLLGRVALATRNHTYSSQWWTPRHVPTCLGVHHGQTATGIEPGSQPPGQQQLRRRKPTNRR